MGAWIDLVASDGHRLDAYRAAPTSGAVRGGVVVVQEIFGLNSHVRSVCDGYAEAGYVAIAPAIFDRAEKKVDLPYTPEATVKGRELRAQIGYDGPLLDIESAAEALSPAGKVAVVGFCWGGSLAWIAAARLKVACAVAYYGGQILQFVHEAPKVPVLLHFGERDALIPAADRATIARAHPAVPIHVYPAGHGFNCSERADFDQACSDLARARTLAFLAENLAG
jgi:carboxymethylenebutenolidase